MGFGEAESRVYGYETNMNIRSLIGMCAALLALPAAFAAEQQYVVFEGKAGPGHGKHVVFLTGDEEYRSEEGLTQMAKILAERHGFTCTVCYSVNEKGEIDVDTKTNEPGIEALDKADACMMLVRFRSWPEEQMKHFTDYYLAGKPFVALRTATHAFSYPKESPLYKYDWQSKEWPNGFGRQVLGETWVNHWGAHMAQGTRGVIEASQASNPLLRGVTDVFGDTDVYEAEPAAGSTVLMRGQVTKSLEPNSEPASYKKKRADGVEQDINDPMMPIAWTREAANEAGKKNKVLCTTMGASTDLKSEGLRRLLVNGIYWGCGLEIPEKADVSLVGEYKPTFYGTDRFKKGVKPSDLAKP